MTIFSNFSMKLFYKTPDNLEINWSTYLVLFDTKVWIAILVCILIMPMIRALFHYAAEKEFDLGHYGSLIFCTLTTLINHGYAIEPSKTSTKILLLLLLFSGIVLNASYSANLTSHLYGFKFKTPFGNLHQLYYDTDFKVGLISGNSLYEYFKVI